MILLMFPTIFSLLDKDLILPFGWIIYLLLHSWNCGGVVYMLLLIIPYHFSLLHVGFILPIWIHVINSGDENILVLLFFYHNVLYITMKIYLLLFSNTNSYIYIYSNKVIQIILWLYSSIIKTFKCAFIISCWNIC